jgi:xylulokinase
LTTFYGIDVGTSFIKGAIIDLDTSELREVHKAPFPEFLGGLPDKHHEVDPDAIMRSVDDLLDRLQRREPRCDGIVFCGQMHGFTLVDERGRPKSNYISWLDQRVTPEEFDEIKASVTTEERRELGNEFRPSIGLPILWWLKRHNQLPSGFAAPVPPPDLVVARLCETVPILEPTQAASLGALRLATGDWHHRVISKLGLDGLDWPQVRPPGAIAGHWRGIPCYSAAGDQQCALAGVLLAPGEVSVNIGTGSQVGMIVETQPDDDLQTRPYFHNRLLRTITHIPGGRALTPLVRMFTELSGMSEDDAWPKIDAAVARVASTDLRAAISFFPGPCGDRGFLENLHDGNLSIGHVFRAAFESMARNYLACIRRIDPGGRAQRLVFTGGVAQRVGLLRELTAKALGLPYRVSASAEDTLYGLMVLARSFTQRR